MKTKFDLTQFEDNSDRTTCTVSVNVKMHGLPAEKGLSTNLGPVYFYLSLR